nr:hypothetical protein [Burkholderia ubonensis]
MSVTIARVPAAGLIRAASASCSPARRFSGDELSDTRNGVSAGSSGAANAGLIDAATSAVVAAIRAADDDVVFERPRVISEAAHQVLVEWFHTTRYVLFIRTLPSGDRPARCVEYATSIPIWRIRGGGP